MNEDLVTNADITVRLQLLNCCIAKSGAIMAKKFRHGESCPDLTTKVIFGFAFIELFCDYDIEDTCVTITEVDNLIQWVNNSLGTCGKCFSPYGTFEDGIFDETFDDSFN